MDAVSGRPGQERGYSAPPLPGSTLGSGQGLGVQAIGDAIPSKGDQKMLVVLVDFPDKAGLFTGQQWQQAMFGAAGFAEYFKEVSYNQLRYTGDIVGLSSGVPVSNTNTVAYVRLPNAISYYTNNMYGFGSQFPRNTGGVVQHAVQALDAAGFDFKPYADPATNKVENLLVVFAGGPYVFTRDAVNSLQATGYSISFSGGTAYTSAGGQILNNYTFCPDQQGASTGQIAYIGICAHEHGHNLGLPDLYDYSFATSGVGRFDLMGYGTYGYTNGLRPFHPGPFPKEALGWITPTVMSAGTSTVTLGPAETGQNFIKLYPHGDPSSKEYFLLENRQALGFDQDWNTGLCSGLLIWHIDQQIVQNYPYAVNSVNYIGGPPHQGVIVVEADGEKEMIRSPLNYGECSDTWQVGRIWNASSSPAANVWDGSYSGLSVEVVSQSGGSVTLRISVQGKGSIIHLPLIQS